MSVLVLRAKDDEVDATKAFFENMGLEFVEEQHGTGPKHWACQRGNFVFEIYPKGSKDTGIQFYD